MANDFLEYLKKYQQTTTSFDSFGQAFLKAIQGGIARNDKLAEQKALLDAKLSQELALQSAKTKEEKPPKTLEQSLKLSDAFAKNPVVKNYYQVRPFYNGLEQGYRGAINAGDQQSKTAADQSLVITFNKMLDPGSVVRESEYARTGEGQAAIAQLSGFIEKFKQGGTGLTNENRHEVYKLGKRLLQKAQEEYSGVRKQYEDYSKTYELDPNLVVGPDIGIKFSGDIFDSVADAEAAKLPKGTRVIIRGRWATIE